MAQVLSKNESMQVELYSFDLFGFEVWKHMPYIFIDAMGKYYIWANILVKVYVEKYVLDIFIKTKSGKI